MTSAERLSLVTSVLAILVSLASAYFQFCWRSDHLAVQWFFEDQGWPSLAHVPSVAPESYSSIRINMSPSLVFANSGNQNVTVTRVALLLLQDSRAPVGNIWRHGTNPPLSECHDQSSGGAVAFWERFAIGEGSEEARPIVIEAGKSLPIRIWFRQLDESVDGSWRADSEVTTCFEFQLIDSRGRAYSKRVPALRFGSSGGAGEERDGAVDLL